MGRETFLYLESNDHIFRIHLAAARRFSIGREERNDFVIRDSSVAGNHAVLLHDVRDDSYHINGGLDALLSVNERPVLGGRKLFNGDVIGVGSFKFLFAQVGDYAETVLQLSVSTNSERPFFVLLDRPMTRIGNVRGDLLISDPRLGSPHCVIENMSSEALYIVNLDSRYGSWLNGHRLSERTRVQDGDQLQIGATRVVVRLHKIRLPGPSAALVLSDEDETDTSLKQISKAPSEQVKARGPVKGIQRSEDLSNLTLVMPALADGVAKERSYYMPEQMEFSAAGIGTTREDVRALNDPDREC